MNSEEFIQTCSSMGYSSKKLAKKYVEKNQKDTYDMDDIISVHRKSGNFKGNHACGLSNIPNGKTTAYSRGCTQQIIEYNKGVEQIKSAGFKVYRNSAGKHKIVIPK